MKNIIRFVLLCLAIPFLIGCERSEEAEPRGVTIDVYTESFTYSPYVAVHYVSSSYYNKQSFELGYVCATWSLPTIASNEIRNYVTSSDEDVMRDGSKRFPLSGLKSGRDYYIRGYVRNKSGITYSSVIKVRR